METIQVGEYTYTILYPDLFRRLDEEERDGLRRSIEEDGILTPILVDEALGVIDGSNRLRIAAELGLDDVPHLVVAGLSDDEKLELARKANVLRRHLDSMDLLEHRQELRQARIARVAAAREAGKSLRTIAEEEGIDKKQVQRDLSGQVGTVSPPEAEEGDSNPVAPPGPPEAEDKPKVTGKDGKKYPKVRRKAKPAVGAEAEAAPPAVATDAVGIPLTPEMAETFAVNAQFEAILKILRSVGAAVNDLAHAKGGEVYAKNLASKSRDDVTYRYSCEHIRSSIAKLEDCRPHAAVCPHCHWEGRVVKTCNVCHGRNWVTKPVWDRCPEDYRRIAEADLTAPQEAEA